MTSLTSSKRGALILSLDFELQWGVYGSYGPHSDYRENILGARRVIPQLLNLFEEFEIAATWATVGFLFAESKEELVAASPAIQPTYRNQSLNPYLASVGESERDDPLHFAPSLIREIQARRRQEIGSHTFSHFYCLEPGGTFEAFRADLASTRQLSLARGVRMRSMVFPRNQVTAAALGVLSDFGFTAYRGRERGWSYDPRPAVRKQVPRRIGRLLDQQYAPKSRLLHWRELTCHSGLVNVPGSLFLRALSPQLRVLDAARLCRLEALLCRAAQTGSILHLWWHPHNFGRHPDLNLSALRRLFTTFAECRAKWNFQSLSIGEAADLVLQQANAAGRSVPGSLALPA